MIEKAEIEKFRAELEAKTKEGIEKYGKEIMKKAIKAKITELKMMLIFSTKDGIGNAPNYDRIQMAIKVLSEIRMGIK